MQVLMPRKAVTYRFDERIVDAVKARARQTNSSANNWLETLLIKVLKEDGVLSDDFEPLGETRGGDRSKDQGDKISQAEEAKPNKPAAEAS